MNKSVLVDSLGVGNPNRPVLYRGKPVKELTREELLQALTWCVSRIKTLEQLGW
jgi:hypothetical protein